MSLITCTTSSKQGQLLLHRISGITENFMEVNTRYLEEYGIVSGSRKQKYISDLSRLIVNSRASHSDKNRIMDGIGILPTDKIKILLAIITKQHNVGMKIELSKNIYLIMIENFDKIKETLFMREHVNITKSYNSFIGLITTTFIRGFAIQKQIDRQILEGHKGLKNKKKGFNQVFQQYILVYRGFMDMQINSICSTVYLNDDVKNLIYSFM
jgi:hypothetical protein